MWKITPFPWMVRTNIFPELQLPSGLTACADVPPTIEWTNIRGCFDKSHLTVESPGPRLTQLERSLGLLPESRKHVEQSPRAAMDQ